MDSIEHNFLFFGGRPSAGMVFLGTDGNGDLRLVGLVMVINQGRNLGCARDGKVGQDVVRDGIFDNKSRKCESADWPKIKKNK